MEGFGRNDKDLSGQRLSSGGVSMTLCKGFATFKQRGEWVELQFMARAAKEGFRVSKPWGDSSAYDVGVEAGERYLRVQVKSTDCRTQYGYLCQFKPCAGSRPYTLKQIDFFAAYVIPKDVVFDSGSGFVGREDEEGDHDFAGEAEASGAVFV
jgi:hypothetical protein